MSLLFWHLDLPLVQVFLEVVAPADKQVLRFMSLLFGHLDLPLVQVFPEVVAPA